MHTSATLMMRFWCICLWCPISNWLRLTGENINSRNFSFMYMPTLVRRGTMFLFRPFSKFYNVYILNGQVRVQVPIADRILKKLRNLDI